MRNESKFGRTFLHADKSKKLKRKNGTELYSVVALSKHDSIDNYEEVDELWSPNIKETEITDEIEDTNFDIVPDKNGNISYEDAKRLLDEISLVKRRIVKLQKSNDTILKMIEDIKSLVQLINK